MDDFNLLHRNVCAFRGRNSELAKRAAHISRIVQMALRKNKDKLLL